MNVISENKSFGGVQGVYQHRSDRCNCDMTFGLFLPQEANEGPVPLLWFLSGLTCTHENAMVKAGAQAWAAEQGIALVFPDTSPRGEGVADDEAFDLGQGAGFYVNATQSPWAAHYQMWDYIADELPALLFENFALDPARQSITGHSMGGHGALVISLKNPGKYKSVSAFSPICSPSRCPWGEKIFSAYLGDDKAAWEGYDAALLIEGGATSLPILIDQGEADDFLKEQLQPKLLEAACKKSGVPLDLRMRKGYDHSYYFIATFIGEHMRHHAKHLLG